MNLVSLTSGTKKNDLSVLRVYKESSLIIFFLLLHPEGDSSDAELYAKMVVLCVCVCAHVYIRLHVFVCRGIKSEKNQFIWMKKLGKGRHQEPENLKKIPERRELEKTIPLIL